MALAATNGSSDMTIATHTYAVPLILISTTKAIVHLQSRTLFIYPDKASYGHAKPPNKQDRLIIG